MAGCGADNEEVAPAQGGQTSAQPLSDQAQLLVDQGNNAQRAGRYSDALSHFSQAMEIHPDHAVPQFGSLMAAMAMGDTALVSSLRKKLEITGPELLEMLGPGAGMGGTVPDMPDGGQLPENAMPPGHPSIQDLPTDTSGGNPAVRG
jgi:hypothetical protein